MARIGKRLVVGIAAAVVVGVVCGALARLMMRLVVVAAGEESSFSIAGTVLIMVVWTVHALPGTVAAALTQRRGRSLLLVAGAVALCFPVTETARTDLEQTLLLGFDVVLVGGAVIGVYVAALLVPLVGLAAVRLLDRRAREAVEPPAVPVDPVDRQPRPSSALPMADRYGSPSASTR